MLNMSRGFVTNLEIFVKNHIPLNAHFWTSSLILFGKQKKRLGDEISALNSMWFLRNM